LIETTSIDLRTVKSEPSEKKEREAGLPQKRNGEKQITTLPFNPN